MTNNYTNDYMTTAKEAKEAARDVLRTKLSMNRMEKINTLEKEINQNLKTIEKLEKDIKVCDYKITQAEETQNPLKEEIIESQNKNKEYIKKNIENVSKSIEQKEKEIEEHYENIKKIEKGETKVNFEEMKNLAVRFVIKKFENIFTNKTE